MMKPGNLILVIVLAPALFCFSQDKAPAAPDSTTPAAPAMTNSYVIGTTDAITIFVWKEPTLSSVASVFVRPDGMISMPLLGDVQASGKTPIQLADEIADKLKKYLQDPHVTITLTAMNSKRVCLIGAIGKTGPIGLTPGMTLLEAIATAGGLTDFANKKKIYILRNDGGKQQKIFVHYKQALRGDSSLNLTLNPGDTIVVP
jgi:polysaccharide export outer membrane protein